MRSRLFLIGIVIGGLMAVLAPVAGVDRSRPVEDDLDLPNLQARPPSNIRNAQAEDGSGDPTVRFAAGGANVGEHPLDLLLEPIDADTSEGSQCVRWAAPRVCTERRRVGPVYWHALHEHYHFAAFADFELRTLDDGGEQPDWSDDGLVTANEKVSFCLADQAHDHDAGIEWRAPYYVSCFAQVGYQGISPGWRDIYPNSRAGQELQLSGVPDGAYAIVLVLNPDGRLYETTRDDNVAWTFVDIAGEEVQHSWVPPQPVRP